MKLNTREKPPALRTHEGGLARRQSTSLELERAVCACLLWENTFYESGESIAERIQRLAAAESTDNLVQLAIKARTTMHLRHAPLLLLAEIGRRDGSAFRSAAPQVIQRADELAEFVCIFGKKMPSRVKRGLADCFHKFNEYQFAKYKGTGNKYSLRDVMFLVHPNPCKTIDGIYVNKSDLFKKIANDTLETPDTWEVEISAKGNNKESWERLLAENKLGYLALLRNLRNMTSAGVDFGTIADAIRSGNSSKIFPFRFIAAWRAAPHFAKPLDSALRDVIAGLPRLRGRTAVLVDVSGSMMAALSSKSDMTRIDAASALAVCYPGDCDVFSFSEGLVRVNSFEGLAGIEAIHTSQRSGGTYLDSALRQLPKGYDRIVIITDEQSCGRVVMPECSHSYIINVASEQPSIVYGDTVSITGFSENVFKFMAENEIHLTLKWLRKSMKSPPS